MSWPYFRALNNSISRNEVDQHSLQTSPPSAWRSTLTQPKLPKLVLPDDDIWEIFVCKVINLFLLQYMDYHTLFPDKHLRRLRMFKLGCFILALCSCTYSVLISVNLTPMRQINFSSQSFKWLISLLYRLYQLLRFGFGSLARSTTNHCQICCIRYFS